MAQYKAQLEELYEDRIRPSLLKRLSVYAISFVRRTGVKVVELESGRVVCRMPLKGNVNHIKTMYAGALFTLAEFPGGPLMLATFGIKRFIPIVTSLDLEFVKAAKTDVTVELRLEPAEIERIERETLDEGKSEFVLNGELKDLEGNVVARSRAVYQMRPKRR
ncbi:MAG: YiiD C-terminal domain-containing protein [Salinisphaeraceae bacterium]|nr:YiiD C-terminal domain-containing protein [Salinisphaeraceae bacterium]